MQYHLGRVLDHVHVRVADLDASRSFYQAALGALGRGECLVAGDGYFHADELFVDRADGPTSRVHIAFQAASPEAVQRFHRDAIAAGGRDNGAPGPRAYHPGYFSAFVLDPDGNNVEAVWHGPVTRSAESVVVEPVRSEPTS
jgi:catechol 2,3-dioxygenase-like lactoylglutathione lyase family enzyme